MKQRKNGSVWQEIIAKNENWFSKSTMRFWGSKVYWDTLTNTAEGWRFITADDNAQGTGKMFTVRLATDKGIETVGQFLQHKTLAEANAYRED